MTQSEQATLAGLDIGGTKVAFSLGNSAGDVLAREQVSTEGRAPADLLADVEQRYAALAARAGVAVPSTLGVACPGPFLVPAGRFGAAPNMPAWQGFALRDFLAERWPSGGAAMNDANAGVLAEHYWGAARETEDAVFLTMSTGMGAGVLSGGQVLEGARGLAAEIGHLQLEADGPVGFARRGSVEGYLSGPGMVQVARAELLCCVQAGEETQLATGEITPARLIEAAAAGDPAAGRVVARIAGKLGQLCSILIDLFDPEVIILGTIGVAAPELWIPIAERISIEESIAEPGSVRLVASPLEERRGDLSALAIARAAVEGGVPLRGRW